jgi:hypothetical protein
MIKKYFQFIKESLVKKTREDFNSLGEWVEHLYSEYSDDEEKSSNLKSIVNRRFNVKGLESLEDVGSDIRLSNAINILDDMAKSEMEAELEDFVQSGIEEKEPVISVSTDLEPLTESEITKAGKGIFHSFLKALTALGQKEKASETERCPEEFLLFYLCDSLDAEAVKQVFGRFQSLVPCLEHIDYGKNETSLYFGVKCDGELEYGVFYDAILTPFGGFKLSQPVIKWLNSIESKSAFALKKELVNLSYRDILILGKAKSDMAQYNPGYHERRLKPELKDRVISFGYCGIGKWDNGRLDESELANLKGNFVTWLLNKSWGSKVLISVSANSYWLYIRIKLK